MSIYRKYWFMPALGCTLALSGFFLPILGPAFAIKIGLRHRKAEDKVSRLLAKGAISLAIAAILFFILALAWPMHRNW